MGTGEAEALEGEHWQMFTCSCCGREYLTRLQGRVNLCEPCAPIVHTKDGPTRLRHSSIAAQHMMRPT